MTGPHPTDDKTKPAFQHPSHIMTSNDVSLSLCPHEAVSHNNEAIALKGCIGLNALSPQISVKKLWLCNNLHTVFPE